MTAQNTTPEKRKPRWVKAFLAHLALTGNVTASCLAAGKDRRGAYRLYEEDADFAADWDEAMSAAADLLEQEARRRAYAGVQKPVIYKGELMGVWVDAAGQRVDEGAPGARQIPLTITEYSDTLLIFLLKGAKPEKYRDKLEVGGTGQGGEVVVKIIGGVSMDDL